MKANFHQCTLADISEIVMGQSPPGDRTNVTGGGTPLLNGPTEFGSSHPNPVQYTTDPRKFSQPEDILFCVRGSTVGRMNWSDRQYAIGRGLAAIRHKGGIEYQHYLRALIKHKLDELLSSSTGSTFPNISKDQLSNIKIEVPPLPEQRAIARILGSLDDKIELNRHMNATLEAMAQAIFKSWFVDFDPVRAKMEGEEPAGLDAETATLFPDDFEVVDGREVPMGWRYTPVEEICETIENGGTPKRMEPCYWDEGTIPWFKTGELLDAPLIQSEELITEAGLLNSSCKLWNPKTILIALYASPTVGRLGILEIEGAANQACSALVARKEYGYLFLYYSLLFSRERLQNVAVGAAQQNINQKVVKEHRILVPTLEIAQNFQSCTERLYVMKLCNLKQSRTLAALRDILLPKLISGEIPVPDAMLEAAEA